MPPFDFDDANPADDAVVSQHPANERASRKAITDAFEVEHHEGTGRHQIPGGTTAARDAITDWQLGSLWWNTDTGKLERQKQAASPFDWAQKVGPEFVSGTRIAGFDQASAPTGWTRSDITGERIVRLAGSGDTGQAEAGAWTIGGLTVASHVHSISHTHTVTMQDPSFGYNSGLGTDHALKTTYTTSSPSAADSGAASPAVNSNGGWRPPHRIILVCQKD